MKRNKYFSVGVKQVIVLFTFVSFVVVVFQILNVIGETERIRNEFENDAEELVDRTDKLLYNYQESIRQALLTLSTQHHIMSQDNDTVIIEYLQKFSEATLSMIKNYYVRKADGRIIGNNQVLFEIIDTSGLELVFDSFSSNTVGMSWSEPYDSPLSFRTIAFSVPYKEKGSTEASATILAEINIEYLESLIRPGTFLNSKTMVILTENGTPVLFDQNSSILPVMIKDGKTVIRDDFLSKLNNLTSGMNHIEYGSMSLFAIKSPGKTIGYTMIVLADQSLTKNSIVRLYRNIILSVTIILIVMFAVIRITVYYFAGQIKKLADKMDSVTDIENFEPFQTKRKDEIGVLAGSYNGMMLRIKEMAKEIREAESKKKEYELKMLQSQINPHFLFNTLACIGSLANQHRVDEVRSTIRDLVSLLSFSFDKISEFIPLEDELAGLEAYVSIQKIRFGDIFKFKVSADRDLLGFKIPRLLLQPLVENAIFHGIKPKKVKGLIELKCETADGMFVIKIIDNGIGMETAKIHALYDGMLDIPDKDGFNSIGLANVYERIKLCYGDGQEFKIVSRPGKGTVISIKLKMLNSGFKKPDGEEWNR